MKNFLTKLPQIWHTLLLVFSFSIPLSIKLNSALIILSIGFALTYYLSIPKPLNLRDKLNLRDRGYLWIFILMYLFCLVGLLYSQNSQPALFDFEQKFPLLILPFIFGVLPMPNERKKTQVQMAFVAATLIICLLNYRNGFYFVYSSSPDVAETNLLVRRPYLGMYCVICIFFCLELFRTYRARWIKFTSLSLIAFFCLFLITLFAKMAFAVLIILFFIFLLALLFKNEKYLIAGVIVTAIILGLSYATFFTSKGKEITQKVMSMTEFDWMNYDPQWVNSVNLRFIKWECAARILNKDQHWLYGAGTGDAQALLDQCYTEKLGAESFFVTEHYNSHNQYLTTWLNQGLIALLFLVFQFGFFLRHHYLTRNLLGCLFTMGILLFCITESIFEVQKGIVFYTFFQLLLYKSKDKTIITHSTDLNNPAHLTERYQLLNSSNSSCHDHGTNPNEY